MLVQDKMIEDVKRIFDLNLYEARLWVSVLSRGVSTAGELSEISSVPRSRTYDVLESLKAKNLIKVKKETRPVKYLAISPEEALEQAKINYKNKMDGKSKEIDELKSTDVAEKLKKLHTTGAPLVEKTDKVALLKTRRQMGHHIGMMFRNAKKGIKIMAMPHQLKHLVNHHQKSIETAKERGVTIQIAAPFKEQDKEHMDTLSKHAQIKTVDKVGGARIYIADDSEVIFAMTPSESVHKLFDTSMWVHSPYFAKAMSTLFDHVWEKH